MFFENPNNLVAYFKDSLERFPKLDVMLDAHVKRLRASQSPLVTQDVLDQLFAIRLNNVTRESAVIKGGFEATGRRLYEIYSPSPRIVFELFNKYPTIFAGDELAFSVQFIFLYSTYVANIPAYVDGNCDSDTKFASIKKHMAIEEIFALRANVFKALMFTDAELPRLVDFILEIGTAKFYTNEIMADIAERTSLTVQQKQELLLPIILTCDYVNPENKFTSLFESMSTSALIAGKCEFNLDHKKFEPFFNGQELIKLYDSDRELYASDACMIIIIFTELYANFKRQHQKYPDHLLRIFEHMMKRHRKNDARHKVYCLFKAIADDSILEKSALYVQKHKLPIYMLDIVLDLWSHQSQLSQEAFEQRWSPYLLAIANLKSARGHHVFERAILMNRLLSLHRNIMQSELSLDMKQAILTAIPSSDDPALLVIMLETISSNMSIFTKTFNKVISLQELIATYLPRFSMQKYGALLQQEPRLIDFLAFILKHQTSGNIATVNYAYKLLDLLATEGTKGFYAIRRDRSINDHLDAILEQRPDLEDNWFAGAKQELDSEHAIKDTDDWRHLMFYGTDMENCQSLTYYTHMYNTGLLGHLFNGTTRLYAVCKHNKVIAYALARLAFDATSDQVVLCLDYVQVHKRSQANEFDPDKSLKAKLHNFAKQRAKALGCELYVKTYVENNPEGTNAIYTLEGVAPVEHHELYTGAGMTNVNFAKNGAIRGNRLKKFAP